MQSEKIELDVRTVGDMFADPETSATVLHIIVLNTYGDAVYGNPDQGIEAMDPVELWLSVKEDYNVIVHENNENKINAMLLAVSTDLFYEDPQAFMAICMSLYDGDMGDLVAGAMEDIVVPEILWGIYEVELNRDDNINFSNTISGLIDKAISEEAEDMDAAEGEVLPYYERILEHKRTDMFEEMRAIGVPEKVIRRLSLADITPRHDEDGDMIQELVTPGVSATA